MINKDKMQIMYQKFKIAKMTSDRARNLANSELDIRSRQPTGQHQFDIENNFHYAENKANQLEASQHHLLNSSRQQQSSPLQLQPANAQYLLQSQQPSMTRNNPISHYQTCDAREQLSLLSP